MALPALDLVVLGADRLERSVWVVVDPRDAVTGQRMTAPVRVGLRDVTHEPIAALSGVYCFTDLDLPAGGHTVTVTPLSTARSQYFDAERDFVLAPVPQPAQPLRRNPVTVDLLPRPAYPFAAMETLARGRLVRSSDSTGLGGADIFLILDGVPQGLRGRSDERGEFVVPFPRPRPEDDAGAGLKDLPFQLRFEIDGEPPLVIPQQAVKEGSAIALQEIQFPGI